MSLLVNPDTEQDPVNKLNIIIQQNIKVLALWVLYTADKQINTLKQNNELNDKLIDKWPTKVLSNFLSLVQDEVKLLLHHHTDLLLEAKAEDPDSGK